MNYLTELLNSKHRKKDFSCGEPMLDNYLHHQAGQDIKRKLAICFVLSDTDSELVKGYYTLSNSGISLEVVPEEIRKKLPKSYKTIPATLLGRLAIDTRFQGQGIGKWLLIDALKRSYETSRAVDSFAVVVDPLDDQAEQFYAKYGFIKLSNSGKMFLAMKTVKQLFE